MVEKSQRVADFKQTSLERLIVERVLLYVLRREFFNSDTAIVLKTWLIGFSNFVLTWASFAVVAKFLVLFKGEYIFLFFLLYGSTTDFLAWELVKLCVFGKLKRILFFSEVNESFLVSYKEIKTLSCILRSGLVAKCLTFGEKLKPREAVFMYIGWVII